MYCRKNIDVFIATGTNWCINCLICMILCSETIKKRKFMGNLLNTNTLYSKKFIAELSSRTKTVHYVRQHFHNSLIRWVFLDHLL